MRHIQTIELGSSQASIEFTSIPQDYDDLVIVVSGRSLKNDNYEIAQIEINGSTANLSGIRLQGAGGLGVASATTSFMGIYPASTAASNTFGDHQYYISNYTAPKNKSITLDAVMEDNSSTAYTHANVILWSNTAAITSFSVAPFANNFAAGSSASLYGITAGGDGTVSTA